MSTHTKTEEEDCDTQPEQIEQTSLGEAAVTQDFQNRNKLKCIFPFWLKLHLTKKVSDQHLISSKSTVVKYSETKVYCAFT